MPVPLVDLGPQHALIADEVRRGFEAVLARNDYILGEAVQQFEAEFARFCGVRHCIGVANGTDALELMARAAGVGPGDEVILPANTFIATALGMARAGAVPVLVDCDPRYHLIDVQQVADRITPRTRAIVPVHLYGQCAPLDELAPIAERAGVPILEDAAQAQGARHHGKGAASVGLAASSSFYPSKNLGAFGDAGAVVSNDDALAGAVRRLRNYGSEERYHHPETGFNSRLDTLQAVVLRAKLRHLADWNEQRRVAAAHYDALLADVKGVEPPALLEGNESVHHLYVVRVRERDRVLEYLRSREIHAAVHYPVPIHLQGALAHLGHGPGDFPVAERAADEILTLPLYPGIEPAQQQQVADALASALA